MMRKNSSTPTNTTRQYSLPLDLRQQAEEQGNPLGWFEALYAERLGDDAAIPWMNNTPHPLLLHWVNAQQFVPGTGQRVLMVGCGLGDDAEFMACQGFDVTAFDISPTAIARCKDRFPETKVVYDVANLLKLPPDYAHGFDGVIEVRIIQSLPKTMWEQGFAGLAYAVKPAGWVLSIANGRLETEAEGTLPLPLTQDCLKQGAKTMGAAWLDIQPHTLSNGLHFVTLFRHFDVKP